MLLLGACTSFFVSDASPPVGQAELTSASVGDACPFGVSGTRIRVADSSAGVDLFLSTDPSNVDELRRRARDDGLRLWSVGDVRTTVVDTPSGARLSVAPVDPARRADVRTRIVEQVARFESHGC